MTIIDRRSGRFLQLGALVRRGLAGRVDAADLSAEMRRAAVVPYQVPHEDPMQMAVYTVIQEKATQVFYSCLGAACEEPVLKQVMDALSRDEARGFHRVELRPGESGQVWTLFVTGPRKVTWGFLNGNSWIPFWEYFKKDGTATKQALPEQYRGWIFPRKVT